MDTLKSLRMDAGLSQAELANKLNLSHECVADLEIGRLEATQHTIKQMSVIFKSTPWHVLIACVSTEIVTNSEGIYQNGNSSRHLIGTFGQN